MDETRKSVDVISSMTRLPVVVGFGVSTPEQARRIGSAADGVVVGSAFVKLIGEKTGSPDLVSNLEVYAAGLKKALC